MERDVGQRRGEKLRLRGLVIGTLAALFVVLGVANAAERQESPHVALAEDGIAVASSSADGDAASSDGIAKATAAMEAHRESSGVPEEQLQAARDAYAKATPKESGSCFDCHTDADALKQAASSEDVDASLFLVDADYATTLHGMLGCTYCHGGDASAPDRETAMAGVITRPTADGGSVCGQCHADIYEDATTSLHYTTNGLMNGFVDRLADASEDAGIDLGTVYYRTDGCPDCHADCGQCHVRKAAQTTAGIENVGFIDGHNFVEANSNDQITDTCLACHAGSITACFTESDVHGPNGANMNCMDCHSISEIHGDGTEYQTMIHSGAVVTECEDCHDPADLSGEWHSQAHLDRAECWACHTVEYRTCTNCHGWFSGERGDAPFQSSDEITLGLNPADGKITTLVKGPVDAGMLGDVGVELSDEQLNTASSLWPGFAHGVIVPEVTQSFCDQCHGEGTELVKIDELQFPDFEAEQVVDPLPEIDVTQYADGA